MSVVKWPFRGFLLRSLPCHFGTKSSKHSQVILLAPLTPDRGIEAPANLIKDSRIALVSNFDIPHISRWTTRRAENSIFTPTAAVRHSADSPSNRRIQRLLYEFALFTCLGLNSPASGRLLDVACGGIAAFGGQNTSDKLFQSGLQLIGLDASLTTHQSTWIDYVRCQLSGAHRLPIIPASIDYIVSISFLQWLTAKRELHLLRAFACEVTKLLAPMKGQAIMQFYPSNTGDLDAVCETFAAAYPRVKGCRISSRPVPDRGMKIFIYLTLK